MFKFKFHFLLHNTCCASQRCRALSHQDHLVAQLQTAPLAEIVAATDPAQAPMHPISLSAATADTKGLHPSRAGLHPSRAGLRAFELTHCMGVIQHGILHLALFILQLWEIVSLCIEFISVQSLSRVRLFVTP